MVYAIARNKAVDFLRIRKKHRVNMDYDAILDAVATDTKDTDLGYRWRLNVGSGEARELREILSKFIPTLPERQRIVGGLPRNLAEALSDPDFRSCHPVANPQVQRLCPRRLIGQHRPLCL